MASICSTKAAPNSVTISGTPSTAVPAAEAMLVRPVRRRHRKHCTRACVCTTLGRRSVFACVCAWLRVVAWDIVVLREILWDWGRCCGRCCDSVALGGMTRAAYVVGRRAMRLGIVYRPRLARGAVQL